MGSLCLPAAGACGVARTASAMQLKATAQASSGLPITSSSRRLWGRLALFVNLRFSGRVRPVLRERLPDAAPLPSAPVPRTVLFELNRPTSVQD